jgi:hypothetical protein
MTEQSRILEELNDRSREVFRRVVEGYLDSGAPVGSRTLTRSLSKGLRATVRNVMQDLEFLGLLGSPHASAGRVPTQLGLRLFVDGFLEVGDLDTDDRRFARPDAGFELCRYPGRAGPRRLGPVRGDAGGQPRPCAEARGADPAYRFRPLRRTGAGGAGLFPMAMSKTASSTAPGHHAQRDARGGEFPERAPEGQTVSSLRTSWRRRSRPAGGRSTPSPIR